MSPSDCEIRIAHNPTSYDYVDSAQTKIVVDATLSANGEVCAQGEVVAVQMPEDLLEKNRREELRNEN